MSSLKSYMNKTVNEQVNNWWNNAPLLCLPIDDDDLGQEPASLVAFARVVVPHAEEHRYAQVLRRPQQKRADVTSLEVLSTPRHTRFNAHEVHNATNPSLSGSTII